MLPSVGIQCLLGGTCNRAEPVTNRAIRADIIPLVAVDAISSGVPVTALQSEAPRSVHGADDIDEDDDDEDDDDDKDKDDDDEGDGN